MYFGGKGTFFFPQPWLSSGANPVRSHTHNAKIPLSIKLFTSSWPVIIAALCAPKQPFSECCRLFLRIIIHPKCFFWTCDGCHLHPESASADSAVKWRSQLSCLPQDFLYNEAIYGINILYAAERCVDYRYMCRATEIINLVFKWQLFFFLQCKCHREAVI